MEHAIFDFVLGVLSDMNLQYTITDDRSTTLSSLDFGLRDTILCLNQPSVSSPLKALEPNTIYHILDYYHCNYSFFVLPDEQLLFVGPYLTEPIQEEDLPRILDFSIVPTELIPQLRDYYFALPYLAEKHTLYGLLDKLYLALFPVDNVTSHFLDLREIETQTEYLKNHQFQVPDDPILSMRLLEKRYQNEDALLDAITQGNIAKARSVATATGSIRITPRSGDQLRDAKNLLVVLNTLLRRAAYNGGVHPFYIDAISSNFARMIERCTTIDETNDIVPYMIQGYCNLVEKRSMTSYSEPVRQILVTVDASLTGDLTLKRFANELFLNTSYLSALFKKEVGMALTDYVNQNRIAHAKKLLKSTSLSIQDIAAQCGIPDVHYFTRLFRRDMGMTPRDFRNQ